MAPLAPVLPFPFWGAVCLGFGVPRFGGGRLLKEACLCSLGFLGWGQGAITPRIETRENQRMKNEKTEYFEAIPSWVGILPVLLAAAENGSRPALAELQRMARQADLLQAYLADEKIAAELRQEGGAL